MNDTTVAQRRRPTVLGFAVVLLLVVLGVIYVVIAIGSGDALWFWPRFTAQPGHVVVIHQGHRTVVTAAHPAYKAIVPELNRSLGRVRGWEDLGISERTMQEYRQGDALVLEVFYTRAERIRSPYSFGRFSSLLLPLEGPHADRNPVFAGSNSQYRSGALSLRDTERLRTTVREVLALD